MAITIDEMLDLLSFAGAELVNGNANHGPMASEALFALGREDAVLPWVDAYRKRLMYRPSPSLPIPPEEWREYLGARERLGDWIELFENELSEAPWQEVVRLWAPRLAPAVMSAATHGLVRTGHAARSLSSEETPQRRNELAQGIGLLGRPLLYALPGQPSAANAGHTPKAALEPCRPAARPGLRWLRLHRGADKGHGRPPGVCYLLLTWRTPAATCRSSYPTLPRPLPESTWPAPRTWWPSFTR